MNATKMECNTVLEQVRNIQNLYQSSKGNRTGGVSRGEFIGFGEAYEQLEKDFEPLLASAVYHYRWVGEVEDLRQVARISFFQAVLQFDCQGAVFFEYYSKCKVYGDLRTHTRRVNRYQQAVKLTVHDEQGQSWLETILVSEGVIDAGVQWKSLLDSFQLSERERKMLDLIYVKQYRYAEVARLWNVDPSTVRKGHKRIIEKIQAMNRI